MFGIVSSSGELNLFDLGAMKINESVKFLINMLCKKGFDTNSKYMNLLNKLRDDAINFSVVKKLIDDFILFYEAQSVNLIEENNSKKKGKQKNKKKIKKSDWDSSKIDNEFVFNYIRFIENVTRPDYTEVYSNNDKKNLLTAILKLLNMKKFQDQIFVEENLGTEKGSAITNYTDVLANMSNPNLFQNMSSDNQNCFFNILNSLLEDSNLSQKIFHKDNIGDKGAIRLYITALSNSACLIAPKNAESNSRTQINRLNVKFFLKTSNKILNDETLKGLIFNTNGGKETACLFLGLFVNLARHVCNLENNEYFKDVDYIVGGLEILMSDQLKYLFNDPEFYILSFASFINLSCELEILTDEQKKVLFAMINEKLLNRKCPAEILENQELFKVYFARLKQLCDLCKDFIDSETLIDIIYNLSNDENVKKSDNREDFIARLLMLDNAIKRYNCGNNNLDSTFKKIVSVLENVQNSDLKFKKQIFETKNLFNYEKQANSNQIARLYTRILRNTSQLSCHENIDAEQKRKFFKLIQNILLTEGCKNIKDVIFNGNEYGFKGAICNLIQVFYNLLSDNNLKALDKKERTSFIRLFLLLLCDEELKRFVFNSGNDGKNGAIDFYFKTLLNIINLDKETFMLEYQNAISKVVSNLKDWYTKNKKSLLKCAYISEINKIEEKLSLEKIANKVKNQNSKSIYKLPLLFKRSKSTNNLILSCQQSTNNQPLLLKNLAFKKQITSSTSCTKTLKLSKSKEMLLEPKKKSSNKQLIPNLNNLKPQVKKRSKNMNLPKFNINDLNQKSLFKSININFKKPKTSNKTNLSKDDNF